MTVPAASPSPSPPQLLVVEDDRDQRAYFQDVLEDMGYHCLAASSLDQALRIIHQQPIDLIVSDLFSSFPQDAAASLRPLLELAHPIPVIVSTAWPVTDAAAQEQGFTGLLRKPFTLDQLVTTVAAGLDQPFSEEQRHQAAVVRRYVAALNKWDLDGLIALLAEDVQYYPWLGYIYPAAHPWRGRTAGRAYYQEMRRALGAWQMDALQLYPCPKGVAARMLVHWHAPAPDGTVRQQMLSVFFQFTDEGQIRQIGIPMRDEHLRALLAQPAAGQ